MKRIDMYIGLGKTGKDTLARKKEIEDRFEEYFKTYSVPYTVTELIGGYVFDNNSYVIEESIKLSVVGDYSKEDIKEFSDVVKVDYGQESVLVDIVEMEMCYE